MDVSAIGSTSMPAPYDPATAAPPPAVPAGLQPVIAVIAVPIKTVIAALPARTAGAAPPLPEAVATAPSPPLRAQTAAVARLPAGIRFAPAAAPPGTDLHPKFDGLA